MGGSLCLAARERAGAEVAGYDPDPAAREAAVARGCLQRASETLAEAVRGADIVAVCAPVAQLPAVVADALVASLGATPVAIDPNAHDRLVALTSHLPHVLANLLANQAGAGRIDGHDPLSAVGGSFRDMTRVAGANPRIWVDIFLDNREALRAVLIEHRRRVEQLEAALAAGDAGYLARWIAEAGGNRRRLLATAYEDPGGLQRLRVHIPDRPGVLAGIFQ